MKNNCSNLAGAGSATATFVTVVLKAAYSLPFLLLLVSSNAYAQSQTFTASGSFKVPAGVTSLAVQCWGAGGGGGNVSNNNVGGGGGGGAYASSNITVVPGNTYNIVIGKGGSAGVWGTSTTFNTNSVVAAGGASALSNSATGAIGGAIAASIGTTRYGGGNGASGSGANAGGGGGGAGSTGNGYNASGSTGGAARNNNGGAGGAGRSGRRGNGTAGAAYGAGGGGAYTNRTRLRTGGPGADGLAIISWVCPTYSLSATSASGPVCPGSTSTISVTAAAASLPVGVYTFTYNLGAPNAATGLTAAVTVATPGTASFTTAALANAGSTTITITGISSGSGTAACTSSLSSNNTAAINVTNIGPAITAQPSSQSACLGGTLSFSVTSPTAVSFQWKKNGVDIYGATSSSYTISSFAATDAAAYRVNAINTCGTTVSNTVFAAMKVAQPAVTANASATTICAGTAINLTASTTSAVTLVSENFNGGTNGFTAINNSTGGTTANAAWSLRANGYSYSGTVFNSNDASQFYLSNSDAQGNGGTTATILQSPAFSTQGLSAASLTFYHYYRFNSGPESAKVEASTNGSTWAALATYTSTQGARNNFSLVTINLSAYLNQPVVFIRFKYDATYDWYWAIDNVNIAGTLSSPSYAWSSVPVGFVSSLQNPTGVTPTGSTSYTAVATNGAGCSNSGAVSVTVNNAPSITTQPITPAPTCSGSGVQTMSVAATGAGLTYSWRRNGTAVVNGGAISGQGTNTLTLTNPTAANTGNYDVVVSGTCAPSATSNAVTVSLNTATSITTPAAPASQSVLLNATPANLSMAATGTALTYQWYAALTSCTNCGVSVGSANGGQTNTYTPPANTIGTRYYYCIATGTCGTATTAAVSVTVTNSNTWAGGGSSNWNTPANWLLGVVPGIANDVVVPAGNTPYPVLSAPTVVNNLTLNGTATIALGTNTLTINGAISGTGTITGSDAASVVIGGNAGTIRFTAGGTGNYLKNFTINNGASATLGNALNITGGASANNEGTLTVTGTGVLNTGGYLAIKSNAFGTARIAPGNTAGGYINGNVSVERYIPMNASKGWRLLASNTIGQTINAAWQEGATGAMLNPNPGYGMKITSSGPSPAAVQALDFDTLSLGKSIFKYIQSTDMLDYVPNTNSTLLNSEHGYFVFIRGDRSAGQFGAGAPTTSTVLRSKGTLFQGDQPAVSLSPGQYAIVRNPYASRLDMRQIARTGGAVAAYQLWDPKLAGAYGVGAFQTFARNNLTGNYEVSPGGGSYGANGSVQNYIESGAAFYVQATGSAGTVQVLESSKTSGSQVASFRPATPLAGTSRVLFNIYAVNPLSTDMVDGGFVDFDNAYSNDVDMYDVRKNQNFNENFTVLRSNTELVVERRQAIASTDTVFFKMYNMRTLSYRMDISAIGFDTLLASAVLEDKYTNTIIPLSLSNLNTYTFAVTSVAASRASDRFRLLFRQAGVVPVTFESIKAMQQPYNKTLVEWKVGNESGIAMYEVQKSTDGRSFSTAATVAARNNNSAYNWLDKDLNHQDAVFYRVKAIGRDGVFIYSAIVKQGLKEGSDGITVYPNPVQGAIANLVFSNQPQGLYNIRLIGTSGQEIYKTVVQHTGGNALHKIKLPKTTTGNIAQLLIESSATGAHSIKLFVQQQ